VTLSTDDARDLDAYYQLSGTFEASISGPILHRAMLYSTCGPEDPDVEYTARPTAEVREQPKYDPNLKMTELLGRVRRKLKMVGPRLAAVLESFYGDRGFGCAERVKPYGRIAAVFLHTPAGRALAKRERLASGRTRLKVSDAELIENAVARQSDELKTQATADLAHRQALELKESAEAAYSAATAELESQRPPGPKKGRR